MTASVVAEPSSAANTVLLVDLNMRRREARAANLRKLGAIVDCVSNAAAALQKYGTTTYRMVLIDLEREGAEQLASEIRLKRPTQLVGFLVDGPKLISKTLATAQTPLKPPVVNVPEVAESPATESSFGRAIRKAEESELS